MNNETPAEALALEFVSIAGKADRAGNYDERDAWLNAAAKFQALARRLQPARVPDGWKLVPVDGLCPDCRYAYNSPACLESHAAAPAAEGGKEGVRRFRGVGELERTGYIPAGSAAEREAASPAPESREAVMANGMTEAETEATASVMGLSPEAGQREGVDPVGEFLAYWESRGEGLFFHFGWDAVNLYNAATEARRLASAPEVTE